MWATTTTSPLPTAAAARKERDPATALEALATILDRLCRTGTPEQHARDVAPLLARVLGAETVAILWARGDATSTVLTAYGPTRKRSYPYPGLDLAEPVFGSLQSLRVVTLDVSTTRRSLPKGLTAIIPIRAKTLAMAGGSAEHALTALVVCGWRRRHSLAQEERLFLTAATDALGLALEHAARTHLWHQSEVVLDTACAVARAISGSLDLEQTFRQIAASAAAVMGDCRCLLTELDGAGDDLVVVAASDPDDAVLLGTHVTFDHAIGDGLRSMVVEDVMVDVGAAAEVREWAAHLRSVLLVPIRSEDGLIGCLFIHSTARRTEYSSRDTARAEALAEQAASAICNARLYRDLEESRREAHGLLERIARLREQNRAELANLVHDEIVQIIVAALYELEGIDAQVSPDSADLERIGDLLRRAIVEARRVIGYLRPPVLAELGLSGALRSLAERLDDQSPATFEVQIDELPDPGAAITTAVYSVAREALRNAMQHAAATRIAVSLTADPQMQDLLLLKVSDDGVGFDAVTPVSDDHFGLAMMRDQAALVGGTFTVTTVRDEGCRIELRVPLRSADADGGDP